MFVVCVCVCLLVYIENENKKTPNCFSEASQNALNSNTDGFVGRRMDEAVVRQLRTVSRYAI